MPDTRLCGVCQTLNLFSRSRSGAEETVVDRYSYTAPLGKIRDIRNKIWCPFCRLLMSHISDEPKPIELHPDTEIKLLVTGRVFEATFTSYGSQILFADGKEEEDCKFDSVRIIREREIDVSLVKKWLAACQTHHPDCSHISPHVLSKNGQARDFTIRALDLNHGCVVEFPAHARYITLSYVWGDVPSVRLTKRNFKRLTTRGSLDSIRIYLPRTIRDAMDFVSMLGERYIWIDALCLISDDETDMQKGIQLMDFIYEGSTLNIIAATGFDASGGLPGVRYGSRRMTQHVEEVLPGLNMAVYQALGVHLKASRYATRGWT
jgi:hypothetical protein